MVARWPTLASTVSIPAVFEIAVCCPRLGFWIRTLPREITQKLERGLFLKYSTYRQVVCCNVLASSSPRSVFCLIPDILKFDGAHFPTFSEGLSLNYRSVHRYFLKCCRGVYSLGLPCFH